MKDGCSKIMSRRNRSLLMGHFLLHLLVALMFLGSARLASGETQRSENEVEMLLKGVSLKLFEYAAKHEERLPKTHQEFLKFIEGDSVLTPFIKDPKFEYHAKGVAVWELESESLLCAYALSASRKMLLMGYGDVRLRSNLPSNDEESRRQK